MFTKKFALFCIIFSVVFISGCKTGLLGGAEAPAPVQPAAPPSPLVVDGVRTSYADVVEKSSPAVVRIEAEHKNKPQSQTQFQVPFGEDFFRQGPGQGQQRPPVERGLGSGVIVSADGTILTNN